MMKQALITMAHRVFNTVAMTGMVKVAVTGTINLVTGLAIGVALVLVVALLVAAYFLE